ncbi:hypothetical protein PYCCODRAFT_1270457 [Trametes coccinea BRFM310]|uniref:Uncharacterized protein n=1 Tax=Trametes coccinea (strain BRFM310) TaxID=1353009 RepID=A0A1Y2IV03_TRAC3|nr:hypothetical protein PYCCODRAFT_1270457 [Trametes coccinea BRFM310]
MQMGASGSQAYAELNRVFTDQLSGRPIAHRTHSRARTPAFPNSDEKQARARWRLRPSCEIDVLRAVRGAYSCPTMGCTSRSRYFVRLAKLRSSVPWLQLAATAPGMIGLFGRRMPSMKVTLNSPPRIHTLNMNLEFAHIAISVRTMATCVDEKSTAPCTWRPDRISPLSQHRLGQALPCSRPNISRFTASRSTAPTAPRRHRAPRSPSSPASPPSRRSRPELSSARPPGPSGSPNPANGPRDVVRDRRRACARARSTSELAASPGHATPTRTTHPRTCCAMCIEDGGEAPTCGNLLGSRVGMTATQCQGPRGVSPDRSYTPLPDLVRTVADGGPVSRGTPPPPPGSPPTARGGACGAPTTSRTVLPNSA